ncbi:Pyrophosphate-energized vacuolar membrane proton pump [Nymphaea thermarum]|nr:Pyrophosphate-energized vacuolar membrane proton pump [Nymphaea thermarum]
MSVAFWFQTLVLDFYHLPPPSVCHRPCFPPPLFAPPPPLFVPPPPPVEPPSPLLFHRRRLPVPPSPSPWVVSGLPPSPRVPCRRLGVRVVALGLCRRLGFVPLPLHPIPPSPFVTSSVSPFAPSHLCRRPCVVAVAVTGVPCFCLLNLDSSKVNVWCNLYPWEIAAQENVGIASVERHRRLFPPIDILFTLGVVWESVRDDRVSHTDGNPVDDQSTSRDHLFGQVYIRKKTDGVETDVVANVEGTNPNPVSAPNDPSPIDEELPIALRKGTRPVRDVADSCRTVAATNVIFGLALVYKSVIIPIFAIAVAIYVSFTLAAMYGVAMAALGMLSTIAIGLTIDAYGPNN